MSLNPRIHYWQGRRVWLVGASSGIGRATAALLHARGAQVIVSARNAQALQAFVDEHPGSVAVPLDTAHTAIEDGLPSNAKAPLRSRCWRAARWIWCATARATTATCAPPTLIWLRPCATKT